ncbi:13295_t:CDS:2, partial [Funneliformis mosseae]
NIFPILNMERYDSWCKQFTKEADAKFNQMIEKNISNRLEVTIKLYLSLIHASDDFVFATLKFLDPKHSLPIDIMGSHIPVVKERAKLELRDPEIYRDK